MARLGIILSIVSIGCFVAIPLIIV
jgi:hypothetical protein